jgi:hypothetical protein
MMMDDTLVEFVTGLLHCPARHITRYSWNCAENVDVGMGLLPPGSSNVIPLPLALESGVAVPPSFADAEPTTYFQNVDSNPQITLPPDLLRNRFGHRRHPVELTTGTTALGCEGSLFRRHSAAAPEYGDAR